MTTLFSKNLPFSEGTSPRVIDAERVGRGVMITFEGGAVALYPSDLLHSFMSKAEMFVLNPSDWESASETGAAGD